MDGLRTAGRPKDRKSEYSAVSSNGRKGGGSGLVDLKPAEPGSIWGARGTMTVAIAKSFAEIEALRSVWQEMQGREPCPRPNTDIDRYVSVIEASGGELTPYVMLFKQDKCPVAMLIAHCEDHPLGLRLGYKVLLRPRLKCLKVVYDGVLGWPQGDPCSLIIGELSRQLKCGEFDVVYFNHLRTDAALYQAIRKAPGLLTRDCFPTPSKHWRMSMPDNMGQFYEARSHRHRNGLRRILRKFEQEYPGPDNFVRYTSEDEVGDFVRMAAGISSKTYQHAIGVGLVNDEQTVARITTAAKQGWFDGGLLFAGDQPCAFQLGLRYRQAYYLVNLGYDPALSRLAVGTTLFLKVLESLCEDPSINTFDFYFGDAEYKKRYGTESWPETSTYIFAPRLYPVFINALRTVVGGTNAVLMHIVNKVSAAGWVKRRWRNLLSRGKRVDR